MKGIPLLHPRRKGLWPVAAIQQASASNINQKTQKQLPEWKDVAIGEGFEPSLHPADFFRLSARCGSAIKLSDEEGSGRTPEHMNNQVIMTVTDTSAHVSKVGRPIPQNIYEPKLKI